jgi:UDP-glucuronate decarboxylase
MMEKEDFAGPVNLGNPHEISINELAKTIIDLTGSHSKIIYKDLPEDDPKRRFPDISLAKKMLDWEPNIGLEEGLKKTIDYFKARI